jgi:hypothetical protein
MRTVRAPSKLLPAGHDAELVLEPTEVGCDRLDEGRVDDVFEDRVAVLVEVPAVVLQEGSSMSGR